MVTQHANAETRPPPQPPQNSLPYIDALRGIAIALVIFLHCVQIFPGSDLLHRAGHFGGGGVQLFYIVSALTLLSSMTQRTSVERRPLQGFFLRRVARIAPLFYLALVLYLAVDGFEPRYWAPRGISWKGVASVFFFVNGWRPDTINSIVVGQWSIAVEMTFCLSLPILFAWIRSYYAALVAWALAVVASGICAVYLLPLLAAGYADQPYLVNGFRYFWFPNQFPVFLSGFQAFFIIRERMPFHRTVPMMLCQMLFLVAVRTWVLPISIEAASYGVLFALSACLLSIRPAVILVNPFTRHLGKVSFSAYILHPLVIGFFEPLRRFLSNRASSWSALLFFGAVLLGTWALSTLSFRYIEKPFIRWGRKIIDWNERRPAILSRRAAVV